jgi:hypothetical protein
MKVVRLLLALCLFAQRSGDWAVSGSRCTICFDKLSTLTHAEIMRTTLMELHHTVLRDSYLE